jgi:hypothetical protein
VIRARVKLGAFAIEALTRRLGDGTQPAQEDLARAAQFYLMEKASDAPGWVYPPFLRGRSPGDEVEMEVSLESSLWDSLQEEARDQGVTTDRLLEHAVLYYAAELDAGRVTERILHAAPDEK